MLDSVSIIKKEYLNQKRYEETFHNHVSLGNATEELCSNLQRFYSNIQTPKSSLDNILTEKRDTYLFLKQFKAYIEDLTSILQEVAGFQIECLESFKQQKIFD